MASFSSMAKDPSELAGLIYKRLEHCQNLRMLTRPRELSEKALDLKAAYEILMEQEEAEKDRPEEAASVK